MNDSPLIIIHDDDQCEVVTVDGLQFCGSLEEALDWLRRWFDGSEAA